MKIDFLNLGNVEYTSNVCRVVGTSNCCSVPFISRHIFWLIRSLWVVLITNIMCISITCNTNVNCIIFAIANIRSCTIMIWSRSFCLAELRRALSPLKSGCPSRSTISNIPWRVLICSFNLVLSFLTLYIAFATGSGIWWSSTL